MIRLLVKTTSLNNRRALEVLSGCNWDLELAKDLVGREGVGTPF
jgi:hypothetical protein